MSLVAKKQRKFQYNSLAQSIRQPWELSLGTTTLNTQQHTATLVRKPYWFVRNSWEKIDDLEKYWATCYATCNL